MKVSYTDEINKEAYFGDLFELTIEEAAKKIHEGLTSSDDATLENILQAMKKDIERGSLKVVRGNLTAIGNANNPAILDAFEVAAWAEKNGLELDGNGSWGYYIDAELEISIILENKLVILRTLLKEGKALSDYENQATDKRLIYMENLLQQKNVEITALKQDIAKLEKNISTQEQKLHPRTESGYQNIIAALLGYISGNSPKVEKHPAYVNETQLIEKLANEYKGYEGMSVSNLSKKLPDARDHLKKI